MARLKKIREEGYETDRDIPEDYVIALVEVFNDKFLFKDVLEHLRKKYGVNKVTIHPKEPTEYSYYQIYPKKLLKERRGKSAFLG